MPPDPTVVHYAPAILEPPAGELPYAKGMEQLVAGLEEPAFRLWFDARFAWYPYPVLAMGIRNVFVHSDLPHRLNEAQVQQAIYWAASLCAESAGARYVSALALLAQLCAAMEEPQAVEGLSGRFMAIRAKAAGFPADANVAYWFSWVARYQLATGVAPLGYTGTMDRAGLNAERSASSERC